jgi:nucleotide-binding universal stress UspA family protein
MFRHIAVAVDFSPATEVLLRSLESLRELGAARITLIHVARLESPVEGWVTHLEYYQGKLEEMRPSLEAVGFRVDCIAVAGEPAEEIVRAAAGHGATLLMVGSRSRSAAQGGFVGRVAWDVVRSTSLPVLVQRVEPRPEAHGAEPATPGFGRWSHVIFATDFSPAAEGAFEQVEALARAGVEAFSLLHVREDLHEPWLAREEMQERRGRLSILAGRLREAGANRVEFEVLCGTPADELLRYAEEWGNALLVLGTHGRGWLSEMLFGSLSHDLLRRTAAAVLLVRPRVGGGSESEYATAAAAERR